MLAGISELFRDLSPEHFQIEALSPDVVPDGVRLRGIPDNAAGVVGLRQNRGYWLTGWAGDPDAGIEDFDQAPLPLPADRRVDPLPEPRIMNQ